MHVTFDEHNGPCVDVTAFYGSQATDSYFVECDFCGDVWDCLGTETDRVLGMSSDGWIKLGEMDFCPSCNGREV